MIQTVLLLDWNLLTPKLRALRAPLVKVKFTRRPNSPSTANHRANFRIMQTQNQFCKYLNRVILVRNGSPKALAPTDLYSRSDRQKCTNSERKFPYPIRIQTNESSSKVLSIHVLRLS